MKGKYISIPAELVELLDKSKKEGQSYAGVIMQLIREGYEGEVRQVELKKPAPATKDKVKGCVRDVLYQEDNAGKVIKIIGGQPFYVNPEALNNHGG